MTSALTRRTRWLLLAGAVALALVINVAWVAFGPESANAPTREQDLEAALRQAWERHGQPVRSVSCAQVAGGDRCRLEPAHGPTVTCAVGSAPPELFFDPAQLAQVCRATG